MVGRNTFMYSKVSKAIRRNGIGVVFTHVFEDKYHNPTEEESFAITGLFHDSTSYQTKTTSEGSVMSTKPSPMFLCMYDIGSLISVGDTAVVNGKTMTVTGIDNIQEQNIALNISLEVNE